MQQHLLRHADRRRVDAQQHPKGVVRQAGEDFEQAEVEHIISPPITCVMRIRSYIFSTRAKAGQLSARRSC